MYEAMAMGKAVVATRTAGQVELDILKDGETGLFVDPGDVQGWCEAIKYLCSHPKEAIQMGQRARSIVEESLNMDTYVQDMVEIVQSLATREEMFRLLSGASIKSDT